MNQRDSQRSLLWLPRTYLKFKQGDGELVSHLHLPIMSGLQLAVDTLKNLASRDRGFFPRGMRIWKLFALQVRLMSIVTDMKEITRHREAILATA